MKIIVLSIDVGLKIGTCRRLSDLLNNYQKNAHILDMGCGGSQVLRLLRERGFYNSIGIDLKISNYDRLMKLYRIARDRKSPYKLKTMDMTKTTFSDSYFDCIFTVSVIEHGVDLEAFLKESNRLLKVGGRLFITTDYWEPKIDVGPGSRLCFQGKSLKS